MIRNSVQSHSDAARRDVLLQVTCIYHSQLSRGVPAIRGTCWDEGDTTALYRYERIIYVDQKIQTYSMDVK